MIKFKKMEHQNRLKDIVFLCGGILMVIGAGCFAFGFFHPSLLKVMCWIFLVGSLMFSISQMMQTIESMDLTLRRLKKLQCFSDICFVLAGISMVDTAYQFLEPLFVNYETYITLVYNKWVAILLIAALIELYTTHRISRELAKGNPTQ
ncbi:hypothetical protein [Segatella cerevisiae]|nr:hypothetical protein [Segatella cerevisiae]